MAIKSYILTQDFKSPYVQITGRPDRPQAIKFKTFRRGDIAKGELKHANNRPAFVLVEGSLVLPLEVVKELVTKEIVSNASGSSDSKLPKPSEVVKLSSNPKVQYIDAAIIGAAIGFGGVYFAEKKGWLPVETDKKMKIYGAIGGALLASYLVYRFKSNKATIKKQTEE
jgi:hypothetical protein